MKTYKSFLYQRFSYAILISIIGICISLYVDAKYSGICPIEIKTVIDIIRTLSIAVFVAGIFSWISSSQKFIERIVEILEQILINKKFLSGLDEKKKKEAMKSLFRSDESVELAPNIDEYYDFYIDHIIKVAHENVRTNYYVNTTVRYDKETGRVICEKYHRYRMYRNEKGFYDDFTIGFSPIDLGCGLSKIKIGGSHDLTEEIEAPMFEEKDQDGEKMKVATIKMKRYESEKYLNIEFTSTEVGYDHWYVAAIQLVKPTNGLIYTVKCEDDLIVKYIDTFSQGATFNIQREEKVVNIIADHWINPGSGISVVVGKKQEEDSSTIESAPVTIV